MQPNLLIFMTDQQRGDVVAPDHPCITPNAARLAAEGIRFTHAYCPSPHCCPSRATFMTGLYPSRHGVYNNVSNPTAIHRTIYDNVPLFSEHLRAAGYTLAYAGKWHVSDTENPADRGWDELEVRARAGSYMHRGIDQWRNQDNGRFSANVMLSGATNLRVEYFENGGRAAISVNWTPPGGSSTPGTGGPIVAGPCAPLIMPSHPSAITTNLPHRELTQQVGTRADHA